MSVHVLVFERRQRRDAPQAQLVGVQKAPSTKSREVGHRPRSGCCNADTAGLRDTLKPHSDVDTVPENVIALDQDVSEVNPDPKQHTPILGTPWFRRFIIA
jgi:hypothetical protein